MCASAVRNGSCVVNITSETPWFSWRIIIMFSNMWAMYANIEPPLCSNLTIMIHGVVSQSDWRHHKVTPQFFTSLVSTGRNTLHTQLKEVSRYSVLLVSESERKLHTDTVSILSPLISTHIQVHTLCAVLIYVCTLWIYVPHWLCRKYKAVMVDNLRHIESR